MMQTKNQGSAVYPKDFFFVGTNSSPVSSKPLGLEGERRLLKRQKKVEKMKRKDNGPNAEMGFRTCPPDSHKLCSEEKNELDTRVSREEGNNDNSPLKSTNQTNCSLEKMVKSPSYITFCRDNVINGFFGHSSLVLKPPIADGSYYMEVKIMQDAVHEENLVYQSSVRVGICEKDYPLSLPIGGKGSLAWKSVDGRLLLDAQSLQTISHFGKSDVIGIGIKMHPLYKDPQKVTAFPRGKITFFKNGNLVYQTLIPEHKLYYIGISLYNYAKVKLHLSEHQFRFPIPGYQPFFDFHTGQHSPNSKTKFQISV